MFVIVLAISVCVGCSLSQEKPSEEVMKDIIMQFALKNIKSPSMFPNTIYVKGDNVEINDFKFDTFQITNGFYSKEQGGGGESTPYNIEVNIKISYDKTTSFINGRNSSIQSSTERINILKQRLDRRYHPGDIQEIKEMEVNIEAANKIPDIVKENKEIIQSNVKSFFVKKGVKWYGWEGWK